MNIIDHRPPLHKAVAASDVELVKREIQKGANVNKLSHGDVPLHIAADRSNLQIFQLLIAHGADVFVKAHGRRTMLHKACYNCKTDNARAIVKLLLESGLDCNARSSDDMVTPFMLAVARSNSLETVKLLLNHGADITAVDSNGRTALHFAAKNPIVDVVKFILDRGLDMERTDDFNLTALSMAAGYGNTEVCEFLLKRGATVNRARRRSPRKPKRCTPDGIEYMGDTPLTCAVKGASVRNVKLLLKYGANVHEKVSIRRGALDLTADESIVELLIQKMVEMVFLNISMNEVEERLIEKNPTYKKYYETCLQEFQNMTETKFYNNVSVFKIFTGSKKEIGSFARNEDLVRALESQDFESKFPVYFDLLKERFHVEVKNQKFRKAAACILSRIFNFNDFSHPIIQSILRYLRGSDLTLLNDNVV